jgi:hypothetical protein
MRHGISVAVEGMPVHGATARVAYTRVRGGIPRAGIGGSDHGVATRGAIGRV